MYMYMHCRKMIKPLSFLSLPKNNFDILRCIIIFFYQLLWKEIQKLKWLGVFHFIWWRYVYPEPNLICVHFPSYVSFVKLNIQEIIYQNSYLNIKQDIFFHSKFKASVCFLSFRYNYVLYKFKLKKRKYVWKWYIITYTSEQKLLVLIFQTFYVLVKFPSVVPIN